MNRMVSRLVVGALLLGLIAAPAAGFAKDQEEPERDTLYQQAPNFHKHAEMVIINGQLRENGVSGWELNGKPLVFTTNSLIDGQDGQFGQPLSDGGQAMVIANEVGGTLIVHYLSLKDAAATIARGATDNQEPVQAPANDPR